MRTRNTVMYLAVVVLLNTGCVAHWDCRISINRVVYRLERTCLRQDQRRIALDQSDISTGYWIGILAPIKEYRLERYGPNAKTSERNKRETAKLAD